MAEAIRGVGVKFQIILEPLGSNTAPAVAARFWHDTQISKPCPALNRVKHVTARSGAKLSVQISRLESPGKTDLELI